MFTLEQLRSLLFLKYNSDISQEPKEIILQKYEDYKHNVTNDNKVYLVYSNKSIKDVFETNSSLVNYFNSYRTFKSASYHDDNDNVFCINGSTFILKYDANNKTVEYGRSILFLINQIVCDKSKLKDYCSKTVEQLLIEFKNKREQALYDFINNNSEIFDNTEQLKDSKQNIMNQIDSLLSQLLDLKKNLKDVDSKILYNKANPTNFVKDFIDTIKTNRLIDKAILQYKNNRYYLRLVTKELYIDYTYEQDLTKALIDSSNPRNAFYSCSPEIKSMFIDALTNRDTYRIALIPIYIDIDLHTLAWTLTPITYTTITYYIDYKDSARYDFDFTNIHYMRYTCLGSFKTDLKLAQVDKDLIKLVSLILQYYRTINLADMAGTTWLTDYNHLFYNTQTKEYILYNKHNKGLIKTDVKTCNQLLKKQNNLASSNMMQIIGEYSK